MSYHNPSELFLFLFFDFVKEIFFNLSSNYHLYPFDFVDKKDLSLMVTLYYTAIPFEECSHGEFEIVEANLRQYISCIICK